MPAPIKALIRAATAGRSSGGGVRGGSSERADIMAGLEVFRREFGGYPSLHVNHSRNRDNLYWGAERWSLAPLRWLYGLAKDDHFSGEDPASPYYWGDLARQYIRYVNQFTFADVNLLNVTPSFPYHLPDKPLRIHGGNRRLPDRPGVVAKRAHGFRIRMECRDQRTSRTIEQNHGPLPTPSSGSRENPVAAGEVIANS